ncbi:MAG: hypothetical protein EHM35_18995, partial [Planctomycetaceae bacterium]
MVFGGASILSARLQGTACAGCGLCSTPLHPRRYPTVVSLFGGIHPSHYVDISVPDLKSPTGDNPGAVHSVLRSMTSWRTAAVSLLSFASGLPFGLVLIAIPDWMRNIGVDIRVVGLITLAQAPWTFKILWSPLIDRYSMPWLGRRRGWVALSQVALLGLNLWLMGF